MASQPAHLIRVARHGGPEVLEWTTAAVPDPGPGEVRLKQAAVGLNFIDVYHRMGYYEQPLPLTPGLEAAGVIDAVGEGVEHLKVGDRVAYAGPLGAYSESRLVEADALVRIPDSVSFETAAAVMLKGLTAHMLVRRVYRVKSGDTILVHAAAGGTGLLLCQWASSLGATVIGTVSTQAKAELAASHGCHHPIVTGSSDFVAEVARLTSGEKLPVVYDSIGRTTFLKSLDCVQPHGLMVSFGQASGAADPIAPGILAEKGSLYLTRPSLFSYISTRAELDSAANEVFAMLTAGKLQVEINQRFPLSQAKAAHEALESRSTTGSTVLIV
jgi:NADPH2:quinone reductase